MNVFDIVFSFLVGLAAGAVYFAVLWLTVRWLVHNRWAPAWLLISTAGRLLFLIAVLFWIMDNDVTKLFATLAGFLVVRFAATRPPRSGADRDRRGLSNSTTPEAVDAADPR